MRQSFVHRPALVPTLALGAVFAAVAWVLPTTSHAEDAPPAFTATTNVALVSQYKFRGIDQTWGRPAAQGGADLAAANGLYAGVWASNVSGNSYPGGSLELDLYGGYNGTINDDWHWTAGAYGYVYPGADYGRAACPSAAFPAPCALPSKRLDTLELNAGLTWKWVAYKLSVTTGDWFGAAASTGYSGSTRGTLYHDLSVTWPVTDSLGLVAHVGRTDVKARYAGVDADYSDWRVALTKTLAGGWNVGASVAGANNDRYWRPPVGGLSMAHGGTRAVNRGAFIVQAGRTF
ncbi:MAG TPA: TorF family putative porin [Burkholderiaceae bacterium]